MGDRDLTPEGFVRDAIARAAGRTAMLAAVASLDLPDAWIAAGAVRNAVWDALHGYAAFTPLADVDVIWFDPARADQAVDRALENHLTAILPALPWSVKNQARMHERNGDPPYQGSLDAMRFWPETATALAARLSREGDIEIAAPFGLDDLLGLVLRPSPRFSSKMALFHHRVVEKQWTRVWPRLRLRDGAR